MKYASALFAVTLLAGCGVETTSTAATAAATKAREAEAAQQTQERFQQKLDAANQQATERLQAMEQGKE